MKHVVFEVGLIVVFILALVLCEVSLAFVVNRVLDAFVSIL